MFELYLEKYPAVIPLLEGLNCDLVFALSVIENKQKGFIFTDSIDKPSCAFIVHYCGGYALITGDSGNVQFNKDLIDLLNSRKLVRSDKLKIIIPNDNWSDVFRSMNDNNWSWSYSRVKFRFNKDKFENYILSMSRLPVEIAILRINKDLFEKTDGLIVPRAFWESADKFIENGVGFAVIKNGRVISSAFSAYICNSMIDIGIETSEEFRGQDFGSYAAVEMINYCLKYRYEPIWGTRSDNFSSIRLAEKLGFEKTAEFQMIVV